MATHTCVGTKIAKLLLFLRANMIPVTSIPKIRKGFDAYLALQRGLSRNTVENYRRDVDKLLRFIDEEGVSLTDVDEPCLERFVCALIDLGIVPRTQARIISGVKSFFKYLKIEGYIEKNPTTLLPTPKLGRHLPDVLSVEEIDAMIDAIDMSTPEGIRNRAIIETLYGCGLRVSELTALRISQVYADDEYVVVEGKGNKQRLVPISQEALARIADYIEEVRSRMTVKPGNEDILFLNRRGKALTRVMVFYIVKDLCAFSLYSVQYVFAVGQ